MNHGRAMRGRTTAIMSLLCLLAAAACASAQQPTAPAAVPARPMVIPMVSDRCPEVRPGDAIALDWNPGFDHPGAVTGLRSFNLTFVGLQEDGVHLRSRAAFSLGGRNAGVSAVPLGNGYFHMEFPVSRGLPLGTYRLVDASAVARVSPDYHGEDLRMTVSPVRDRLCVTVVGSASSRASPPGS